MYTLLPVHTFFYRRVFLLLLLIFFVLIRYVVFFSIFATLWLRHIGHNSMCIRSVSVWTVYMCVCIGLQNTHKITNHHTFYTMWFFFSLFLTPLLETICYVLHNWGGKSGGEWGNTESTQKIKSAAARRKKKLITIANNLENVDSETILIDECVVVTES